MSDQDKMNNIEQEDLLVMLKAKHQWQLSGANVEKSILEQHVKELEYKNIFLNVLLKYKLSITDVIDDTGRINPTNPTKPEIEENKEI